MPKELEKVLRKEALKKHLTGEHYNRYVYGTLQKVKKEMEHKR